MRKQLATLIILATPWVAGANEAQPVARGEASTYELLTYTEFMKLSPGSRREIFNEFSAEKRAGIMRTHIERWRDVNRERLTAAQLECIEDALALTSAELYRSGPIDRTPNDPRLAAVRKLEEKVKASFTGEEAAQLLTLEGPAVDPALR